VIASLVQLRMLLLHHSYTTLPMYSLLQTEYKVDSVWV